MDRGARGGFRFFRGRSFRRRSYSLRRRAIYFHIVIVGERSVGQPKTFRSFFKRDVKYFLRKGNQRGVGYPLLILTFWPTGDLQAQFLGNDVNTHKIIRMTHKIIRIRTKSFG